MARLLLTTSLCCSVGIVASIGQAKASAAVSPTEQTFSFSIPAQSLDGALATFSKITHIPTVAAGELTRNARSPGISGTMTPTAAMNVLLGGTGLSPRTSGNVIIIQKAAANITLGPVRVGGTVAHQDPTGPGVGYVAENTMVGTKTDTPITEIPNSIYVVTKQLMQDQQPQSVAQALRYVPGIYAESLGSFDSGAAADGSNSIKQRGFSTSQFVDGLMSHSQSAGETTFLERIEAVNGPASVMYGQTTPGGMLGITLKKPTQTPLKQVSVGFGNWGRYEATFDISDKVTKSGNVRYRIAGIGVTQGTQVNFVDYHRVGVLPSITWDIDKKTSLTLTGMYMYTLGSGASTAQYPYQGTLIQNSEFPRISRSNFLSTPNWNTTASTDAMFEYQFSHTFNKYLGFKQTFRWEQSSTNNKNSFYGWMNSAVEEAVVPWWIKVNNHTVALDSRISGKFTTGPLNHTWVVGSDFRQYKSFTNTIWDWTSSPSFNIYNPQPSYTPCYNVHSSQCMNTGQIGPYNYFQEGVYFQDQIKWKGLSILLGGREDWVNYNNKINTYSNEGENHNWVEKYAGKSPQPQHAFTWRAGIVYKFNFGLSPYFSYSTSFVPQNTTNYLGQPFSPLTGKQLEAGLKYKIPNRDILLTAAAFHIDEDHYLIGDLVHGGSMDAGRVKSQGFELSANANITENLKLIATYSFTDIRYAKTNKTSKRINPYTGSGYGTAISQEGMSVPQIPRNMFSVFFDYKLPSKWAKGFGVNWGMRYTGFTYADNVESFKSPDYFLFDIGAHYDLGEATPILRGLGPVRA
ncbi:TonB-dependent siderophore receptor [Acetobacter cerevisiae]|uniref:TonB-dependent siderophore receptor n=1 Tax=Acetobacter cerevisiae TaxID=178900 RepID=A0ABT1ETE9_9PROT|nr:TonB-dependent siderophore receptor [Acetobacter cerevisiae]MCP1246667.1 TonB-dependent siderophore receptor [Acetobacter cerevisiae]MCP1256232.1 TonB-dependent siderophore receptor [Acetobacter cerevisiae]